MFSCIAKAARSCQDADEIVSGGARSEQRGYLRVDQHRVMWWSIGQTVVMLVSAA